MGRWSVRGALLKMPGAGPLVERVGVSRSLSTLGEGELFRMASIFGGEVLQIA